ncbi:MAG: hypothetical protein EPO28_12845 [Saprospiraceae bacterium]|nr:MAG: hypothetical protein EPO28_12845 [Saprospiraceae bacterium]
MKFLWPSIILLLLVLSCKKTSDGYDPDFGYQYFPLGVGKYWVYSVDSTIFDPTGNSLISLSHRLVKEEITDTLHDISGNPLYKIERFERQADTLPWQITKVLTQSIIDNKALRTEDNLRFIKLPFPLRKNDQWDGNAYFDPSIIVTVAGESMEMFKDWSYKVEQVDEPENIGSYSFPAVATIRQANNENLIELRISKEKYAKGVGLVYRELWILDTQCIEPCTGQTWEEKAEKGFILKQTIIAYN